MVEYPPPETRLKSVSDPRGIVQLFRGHYTNAGFKAPYARFSPDVDSCAESSAVPAVQQRPPNRVSGQRNGQIIARNVLISRTLFKKRVVSGPAVFRRLRRSDMMIRTRYLVLSRMWY